MSDVYEIAARRYCADRGLDPEERVQIKHPEGFAVMMRTQRWRKVAEEMQDLDLRMASLRMAKSEQTP